MMWIDIKPNHAEIYNRRHKLITMRKRYVFYVYKFYLLLVDRVHFGKIIVGYIKAIGG